VGISRPVEELLRSTLSTPTNPEASKQTASRRPRPCQSSRGCRIGVYEIREEPGTAAWRRLQGMAPGLKVAAVKMIPAADHARADEVARFKTEAEAVARGITPTSSRFRRRRAPGAALPVPGVRRGSPADVGGRAAAPGEAAELV
jgi:hypothetical protein